MPSVTHRRSKYLNNRAENSHQPTRQRQRAMKRFMSIRHPQRFLSAFSGIWPHFRPRRHLLSAADYRQGDGRPLRGLDRDHRGGDHGRRLNRRLGQDVSSKPRLITPNHHIGQLGWLKLTVPRRMAVRWPAAARPRSSRGAAVRAIRFRKTWSTRRTDRDRVDRQPIECALDRCDWCVRQTDSADQHGAAVGRREARRARGAAATARAMRFNPPGRARSADPGGDVGGR